MIGGMAHDSALPRRIIDLDERELAEFVGAVLDQRVESLRAKPVVRLLDRSTAPMRSPSAKKPSTDSQHSECPT